MSESNLDLLRHATEGMSLEDSRRFDDYFIGALSLAVSQAKWVDALGAAQRCFERAQKPTP